MAKMDLNADGVRMMLMAASGPSGGPQWRLRAACRETDPESFFPANADDAVIPKKICRKCAVRPDCFADRQPWGIWGGTTEWERNRAERRAA
jgi:WhiB family redox-sensing transcriptional regulator